MIEVGLVNKDIVIVRIFKLQENGRGNESDNFVKQRGKGEAQVSVKELE